MKIINFLFSLLLSINLFIVFVSAQAIPPAFGAIDVQGALSALLGVPRDVVAWPTIFWAIILPYFATVAIIIGIFEEIDIFRRARHKMWLYFFIALGWAMFLIPTGILGILGAFLYGIGALVSVITFMGMFFAGIAILWTTRIRGPRGLLLEPIDARIRATEAEIAEIDRRLPVITDVGVREQMLNQRLTLVNRLSSLRAERATYAHLEREERGTRA